MRVLALGLALAGLALLPAAAGSGRIATGGAPRVTLFGDSVADALEYVPDARALLGQGLDLRLELAPCRKLVPAGCPYQGARPPSVLDIVESSTPAQLGNIVVVDVGYNDPANNYDTDMAQVVNALLGKGVGYIVWVTLREQDDDYRSINQIIGTQSRRWPQVRVADWDQASRGQTGWFNQDGVHLTAAGAMGLAGFLRPYVLAACGAPCQPEGPQSPQAPQNTRPPALRGTPVVGRVLRCSVGSWSGTGPLVFSYRWLREGRTLPRVHSGSRRLVTKDAGRRVSCRVWASNTAGSTSAGSKALRVRRPA